jgi:hypothetical protein
MAVLLKMPLDVYLIFIERCPARRREYAVLENAIVEHGQDDSVPTVHVLCDTADAQLLLQRAELFYPDALPYMQQSLPEGELGIVAMEYRREPASQTWHFCSNCSQWPSGFDFIVSQSLPDGCQMCNECAAKNQQGECQ